MEIALLALYGFFLTFILFYSFIQLSLALKYRRAHKEQSEELQDFEGDFPFITVQLPVFNELYVVERLIEQVSKFDWPKDRFEIQVLDDSTDESVEVAAKKIEEVKTLGIDIQHVRRSDRSGFKAGALAYGLEMAKGDLIAIFDADFLPRRDMLKKVVPFFKDPEIGVVQTKWEHINNDHSVLTQLQAFGLDAHFRVEQAGRNAGGHFINFNGTAGVWRKETIIDAGGWQSDTLTEDLDLSYRAQLNGWKFKYLEELESPAELPAAMKALKTQQYRWTKGAAECAVKNLPKVIRKKGLGFGTKVHAVGHLLNSFIFICVLATALLSIPVLLVKHQFPDLNVVFQISIIYGVSMVILAYYYWVSMVGPKKATIKEFWVFLRRFPMFLSVSMGLSLHNAIAVVEGYIGRKTPFVRTPKFNILKAGDSIKGNKYLSSAVNMLTILEALLTFYFIGGVVLAIVLDEYALIPFHVMLSFGFGYVAWTSFVQPKSA